MPPQRTVIVADDVAEIRNLVAKILEPLGFKVLPAASGREAAKLVRVQTCDLVITDILMPEGDGLEVITELRQTDATVKVLAISGGGGGLTADYCAQLARGLGAHATLAKPFDQKQLIRAVQALLDRDERE